ncbi:MAG: hypothetical protein H8D45_06795 [Bacteroidetes bacterium]|nr:hypothetical protein [Bacteroidota bacterium]
MNNKKEHLETLSEIRTLMERSSKFLSLSGISGISAGVIAIIGVVAASIFQGYSFFEKARVSRLLDPEGGLNPDFVIFFLIDAIAVIILVLSASAFFTIRKAKKRKLPVWDNSAKRLVWNLLIPLAAGGAFCLILVYYGAVFLITPSMLIFYGLSLINASKFTHDEIGVLGVGEILLGIVAAFFIGYGLLFWTIGFGLFHIIYGMYMYYKYER